MHDCILCGEPTEGSIGAAGIKWMSICQPCKDREDSSLAVAIKIQANVCNLFESLFPEITTSAKRKREIPQ